MCELYWRVFKFRWQTLKISCTFISYNFRIFLFYVNETWNCNFLHTVDSIHATYVTSAIFLCYGSPRNSHGCTQQHHSTERNYLLDQKILAHFVHSCTFKERPKGQILWLSSCYIVNQENNNFGLYQCFQGPFLSEKQNLSLYAVIASLCQLIYKCRHILQKMLLRIQSYRDTLEINLCR
jgi:hypothetical protein